MIDSFGYIKKSNPKKLKLKKKPFCPSLASLISAYVKHSQNISKCKNSNISPCKHIIFRKISSKRNQNPSTRRCHNTITNLKF
jgi:hypothetical protein